MKHKYPATFPLLCIVFLHITFLACERRELTYYEVADISSSAVWSLSGLDCKEADFGATALFYPQTGGEPKVFLLGDRSGDKIRLPEGIYHVLLFNRSFNDFSNITFRGKECYETLEACAGKIITRPDEGKVFLEGKEVYIKTPSEAMEKGVILLPEDRQKEGLIMSWGLGRNVTLPIISKYANSGFNDEKAVRELSKKLLEEVDTKAVDIFQPASSLSGGNQQKVVVAKALAQEMKVVIMDEPTKGVDVGAKAVI